ncbi:Eco29kI family restriction endonuclease [Streptosporangium sp. NPDC049304]|uniref:Eco29kI family restriction endonuclease n=1 Tax=Streptosporangium sp. NPDC049304 TaxID=3154830 RepID=UPI0034329431
MAERDYLSDLGDELRRLIASKGWSVQQLADRCGKGRTTISQALNARSEKKLPSIETIVQIARILGVDDKPLLDMRRRGEAQAKHAPTSDRDVNGRRRYVQTSRSTISQAGNSPIFDPLRRENLARSVQWALESSPAVRLDQIPDLDHEGIYALYYAGDHTLYQLISSRLCETPLYVSLAYSTPSWGYAQAAPATGRALRSKLRRHRKTLDLCADLNTWDFYVRYLLLDNLFASEAVGLMIDDHQPLWNVVLGGFGNFAPGSARRGPRSVWHELHSGVPWADALPSAGKRADELRAAVHDHLLQQQQRIQQENESRPSR